MLKRIFISHSWRYDKPYKMVCDWLDSERNFCWSNYSIPEDKKINVSSKKDLKQAIINKICAVNCVVIFAGMYTNHSEWIDFEIDTAQRFNKSVVVIRPWGQERMPLKVQEAATVLVNWNKKSVVDAIKRV